jgi:Tol biopolymer transport system component
LYTESDPHGKDPEAKQIIAMEIKSKQKHLIENTAGAFNARISADGKQIAFINGSWPQSQIYVANANGTNVVCVTCKLTGD